MFPEFDQAQLGRIAPKDARLILRELGIEGAAAQELVTNADFERRGMINYETFLEVLRLHLVIISIHLRARHKPNWKWLRSLILLEL
jgi:hypothetical protein